jgi:hypothetical protein
MALLHLGCPACGGALCLAEGERITVCRYCGGRCLVLVPEGVPRYAVEASVGREAAVRIALESLRRPDVPAAVRGRTGVDAAGLCYVPFFEATAVRLGTVFVRERVKPPAPLGEGEQGGQALDRWLVDPGKEREDTKVVEQDVLRIAPACELPELGVAKIRLADLRRAGSPVPISRFDGVTLQSRAVVFAPTTSAERFLEETTWRVPSVNDDTRYVDTRLKLLYYPVWRMRYRHRGRVYELAVDGVQGTLLHGTAPRNVAAAAAAAAAGLGLGALGLGRWLRWVAGAGGVGPAFLLAAIAGGLLLWISRRWVESGEEIDLVSP